MKRFLKYLLILFFIPFLSFTFELIIEYSMVAMRAKYGGPNFDIFEGFPEWEESTFYENQEIVEHAGSMWQTGRQIDPDEEIYPDICNGVCSPNSVYDMNGDNIVNVTDVVATVNIILGNARASDATSAKVVKTADALKLNYSSKTAVD